MKKSLAVLAVAVCLSSQALAHDPIGDAQKITSAAGGTVLATLVAAGLVGSGGAGAIVGKVSLAYSVVVLIALQNMNENESSLTVLWPFVAPTESTENTGRKNLDKANAQLIAEDAIQYQATGEKTSTFNEHCQNIRSQYAKISGVKADSAALPDDDKIAAASIWAAQQM